MDGRMLGPVQVGMLGYGCMRFPLNRETRQIDEDKAGALLRRAMEAGVTYYDTAWPYHEGESEAFLGRALAEYPRERYQLATKLPCWKVSRPEQALDFFYRQLERLNTDYVDFYLLHSLGEQSWRKMRDLGIPELMENLKREGKIRQFGFSFHDRYEVLEEILTCRNWDFCQLQLNYMDTETQAGLRGYHLAQRLGVPVVVMEPVKGGSLALLPEDVSAPLKAVQPKASPAAWAMRWVGSLSNVRVILSGMTTMEQLDENLETFTSFEPLEDGERAALEETAQHLRRRLRNGCTDCRYCMPCPAGVNIPQNFAVWNGMSMFQNRRLTRQRWRLLGEGKAELCVGCGSCEETCPQHIPIRAHLKQVTEDVGAFVART